MVAQILDDKGQDESMKGVKTGLVHGPAFKQFIPEIEDFVRVRAQHIMWLEKDKETFNQDVFVC